MKEETVKFRTLWFGQQNYADSIKLRYQIIIGEAKDETQTK
jgi:hypothetical protein